MISSRTPEGSPNHCPVCGQDLVIEPSTVPMADAPCPHCGCFLLFQDAGAIVDVSRTGLDELIDRLNEFPRTPRSLGLTLDCEGVEDFDSVFLGRLIRLHMLNSQLSGGGMVRCNVAPELLEILQLVKLDRILEIR